MKPAVKKLILNKNGKINQTFQNMIDNCRIDHANRKIYHTYTSGSGRFTSNQSAYWYVTEFLKASGYKFKEGNDAPRGGKTGDFIKVSKTALKSLSDTFSV